MRSYTELDDPAVTGVNRQRMHAPWDQSPQPTAQDLASTRSLSLDGLWRFHLAADPQSAPAGSDTSAFDDRAWAQLVVPSNWELHGFGEAVYCNIAYPFLPDPPHPPLQNPTGCYRRRFQIPQEWSGTRLFLHFGSVDSAFRCWVNGAAVGMSTDSKLPAEFEITDLVRPGENDISVRCYRFAASTYLEKQDYWHLSGIQRSVTIFSRPRAHLRDWSVRTHLEVDAGATVRVRAWMNVDEQVPGLTGSGAIDYPGLGGWSISGTVRLLAPGDQETLDASAPVGRRTPMYGATTQGEHEELGSAALAFSVHSPRLWTAETPHLYLLTLTLRDAQGQVVDTQCQRFGLRQLEIRAGVMTLNGRRLVIRGVNRHEFSPESGRVLSREEMRTELIAMKRLNFNAVRTCHYPNDSRWYELCDELGMYVVDEANLETHGLEAQLSRDPAWAAAYLERAVRMVLRDRNHACIISWSLGNESFYGPHHAAMAAWIRFQDPTRPVQYESGSPPAAISDVLAPMYPQLSWVRQELAKPSETRPMIMCEYAYAKGNSTGNVDEFWDLVWELPRFQGGFVWDWRDKVLREVQSDGSVRYRYGVQRHEPRHVERMCINGVVGRDLTPHPGAWELSQVQAPVALAVEDAGRGQVRVHNRYLVLDTGHLQLRWRLQEDGRTLAEGLLPCPLIEAGATGAATIDLPALPPLRPGAERFLECAAILAQDQPWAPLGHEIAHCQGAVVSLPPGGSLGPGGSGRRRSGELRCTRLGELMTIEAGDVAWRFDTAIGALKGWSVGQRALLAQPVTACFYRAPTDIDHALGDGGYAHQWHQAGLDRLGSTVEQLALEESAGEAVLTVTQALRAADLPTAIQRQSRYRFLDGGGLEIEEELSIAAAVATLPRVGLRLALPGWATRLDYYGRGPHENYPDRHRSCRVDRFRCEVSQQLTPYIFPQECGLRTAVRWAAIQGSDGLGVLLRGRPTFQVSVLPVRLEDLALAKHHDDLPRRQETSIHLDGFHQGLGGDTGWTQNVHPAYLLKPGAYRWSVALLPLRPGEDAAAVAAAT